MAANTLDVLLDDSRYRPLLPLLHTAWADGSLTTGEIERIRSVLCDVVDGDCVPVVESWLDPDHPPSAGEVARLGRAIRDSASAAPRMGPVELGLRLAGSVPDPVAEALRTADAAVGPFEPPLARSVLLHPGGRTLDPLPAPGAADFDRSELKRLLAGPHGKIKRRVFQILSRDEFAYRQGLSMDEYRTQVRTWLRGLVKEEIGALGYPREVGGAADPGGFLAAFSTLAHHDLSLLTKFGVQFGLFAGAIMRLGTDRHHELLVRAVTGEEWGCFAMTETGHGSNVADLETTATFLADSGEFEIDSPTPRSRKDYIGNAAVDGETAVVFARLLTDGLDHGVHAFVVPIRMAVGEPAPGVSIGDDGPKAGLNGVDNGWIMFDRVRVSRHALLDRFAGVDSDGGYQSEITSPARRFFTTLGTLVGGRVSVASAAVSVAESALTIAVRYAHRRRQFSADAGAETLLIDYPSHQRRLMPRLAAAYGYHFALAELGSRYVELESGPGDIGADRRAFEGRAAGLKAFATWYALDTVAECRQACGGQGYMAENRLGPMAADADVFTTFEGDNTVLAQLLAKALLTDHRSSFDDFTPGRMVRYVFDRVSGFVTESVPVVGAVGGELDDPATCAALMSRRSRQLLESLAARVKARIDDGMDANRAFLDVQHHAVAVARTATELEVLEALRRVDVSDPRLQTVFDELAALFALWRIEADMGGYLTTGLVTSNGASQTRTLVTDLSEKTAGRSRHLVDAFGIPPEVLAAPIAL